MVVLMTPEQAKASVDLAVSLGTFTEKQAEQQLEALLAQGEILASKDEIEDLQIQEESKVQDSETAVVSSGSGPITVRIGDTAIGTGQADPEEARKVLASQGYSEGEIKKALPSGSISVSEDLLKEWSKRQSSSADMTYAQAKATMEAAVEKGQLTKDQAVKNLGELISSGFASGPSLSIDLGELPDTREELEEYRKSILEEAKSKSLKGEDTSELQAKITESYNKLIAISGGIRAPTGEITPGTAPLTESQWKDYQEVLGKLDTDFKVEDGYDLIGALGVIPDTDLELVFRVADIEKAYKDRDLQESYSLVKAKLDKDFRLGSGYDLKAASKVLTYEEMVLGFGSDYGHQLSLIWDRERTTRDRSKEVETALKSGVRVSEALLQEVYGGEVGSELRQYQSLQSKFSEIPGIKSEDGQVHLWKAFGYGWDAVQLDLLNYSGSDIEEAEAYYKANLEFLSIVDKSDPELGIIWRSGEGTYPGRALVAGVSMPLLSSLLIPETSRLKDSSKTSSSRQAKWIQEKDDYLDRKSEHPELTPEQVLGVEARRIKSKVIGILEEKHPKEAARLRQGLKVDLDVLVLAGIDPDDLRFLFPPKLVTESLRRIWRSELEKSPGFIKSTAAPTQATVDARRLIVGELERIGLASKIGDFRVKRELDLIEYFQAGGSEDLIEGVYLSKDIEEAKRWVNIEKQVGVTGARRQKDLQQVNLDLEERRQAESKLQAILRSEGREDLWFLYSGENKLDIIGITAAGGSSLLGSLGADPEVVSAAIRVLSLLESKFPLEASRFGATGRLDLKKALDAGVSGDDLETLGFDPGTIFVLKKGHFTAPPSITGELTLESKDRRDKILDEIQRELDFQRGTRGGLAPSDPDITQSVFFSTKEQSKQIILTSLRKGIESGAIRVDEGWKTLEDINNLEIKKVPVGQEAYMIPGYGTYLSYQDMREEPDALNIGFFILSATGDVLLFTGAGFAFKTVRIPFSAAKGITKTSIAEAKALGRLVPGDVKALGTLAAKGGITGVTASGGGLVTGTRLGFRGGVSSVRGVVGGTSEAGRLLLRGGRSLVKALPEVVPTTRRVTGDIVSTIGRARTDLSLSAREALAASRRVPGQIQSGLREGVTTVRSLPGQAQLGLRQAKSQIQTGLVEAAKGARGAFGTVSKRIGDLESSVSRGFGRVQEGTKALALRGQTGVQVGFTRVRGLGSEISGLVSKRVAKSREVVRGVGVKVKEAPSQVQTKVKEVTSGAISGVQSGVGGVQTSIGTGVKATKTKVGQIVTTVKDLPIKVASEAVFKARNIKSRVGRLVGTIQDRSALAKSDILDRFGLAKFGVQRQFLFGQEGVSRGLLAVGPRLGRGVFAVKRGIVDKGLSVREGLGRGISSVKSGVSSGLRGVRSQVRGGVRRVKPTFERITSSLREVAVSGLGTPKRITSRVVEVGESLKGGIQSRVGRVQSEASRLKGEGLSRFESSLEGLRGHLTGAKEAIRSRFVSGREGLGSGVRRLRQETVRVRQDFRDRFRRGKGFIEEAGVRVSGVPGRIQSRVSGFGSGVQRGIGQGLGRVREEIQVAPIRVKEGFGTGVRSLKEASIKAKQEIFSRVRDLEGGVLASPRVAKAGVKILGSGLSQGPSFAGRAGLRVGRAGIGVSKRGATRLRTEASRLSEKVMAGDTEFKIPGELKRIVRRVPGSGLVSKVRVATRFETDRVRALSKVLPSTPEEDLLDLVRKYRLSTPSEIRVIEIRKLRPDTESYTRLRESLEKTARDIHSRLLDYDTPIDIMRRRKAIEGLKSAKAEASASRSRFSLMKREERAKEFRELQASQIKSRVMEEVEGRSIGMAFRERPSLEFWRGPLDPNPQLGERFGFPLGGRKVVKTFEGGAGAETKAGPEVGGFSLETGESLAYELPVSEGFGPGLFKAEGPSPMDSFMRRPSHGPEYYQGVADAIRRGGGSSKAIAQLEALAAEASKGGSPLAVLDRYGVSYTRPTAVSSWERVPSDVQEARTFLDLAFRENQNAAKRLQTAKKVLEDLLDQSRSKSFVPSRQYESSLGRVNLEISKALDTILRSELAILGLEGVLGQTVSKEKFVGEETVGRRLGLGEETRQSLGRRSVGVEASRLLGVVSPVVGEVKVPLGQGLGIVSKRQVGVESSRLGATKAVQKVDLQARIRTFGRPEAMEKVGLREKSLVKTSQETALASRTRVQTEAGVRAKEGLEVGSKISVGDKVQVTEARAVAIKGQVEAKPALGIKAKTISKGLVQTLVKAPVRAPEVASLGREGSEPRSPSPRLTKVSSPIVSKTRTPKLPPRIRFGLEEFSDLELVSLKTSVYPSEGGSASPGFMEVNVGRSIQIVAKANPGWRFVRWEGDVPKGLGESSYLMKMDVDKEAVAVFERGRELVSASLKIPGIEVVLPTPGFSPESIGHRRYKVRDPRFPGRLALGVRSVDRVEAGRISSR